MAVAFVDKTWAQTFMAAGERYVSQHVVGYDYFVMTACGRISGMNTYSCDLDAAEGHIIPAGTFPSAVEFPVPVQRS